MNVTEAGKKYSQSRKVSQGDADGSFPQKDSAEHERYAEACNPAKITENNITNANKSEERLLEEILDRDNLNQAFKRVRSTVVDRVIQQAIAQKLTPIFEPQFSDNSYGYRPGRKAQDAIRKCQQNIDEGFEYVVDMDLEKYFDTVNHGKLVEVLSRTIKDGRVISLIHKYLTAGVVVGSKFEDSEVGVPQGGPLSPILSNTMLNELDKELEKRGHRFVRYADDMLIFCRKRVHSGRWQTLPPLSKGSSFSG